jgi:hypothetical protein
VVATPSVVTPTCDIILTYLEEQYLDEITKLRGCGRVEISRGIFQVIILSHFNVWWDNKVNGCLEKTLIIPRLLQPAWKCQEAKLLLRIG